MKVLDKLKPPKLKSTTREAYLDFPEDSSEFPIEVSDDDEESFENSTESDESNDLDSEEDEEL